MSAQIELTPSLDLVFENQLFNILHEIESVVIWTMGYVDGFK